MQGSIDQESAVGEESGAASQAPQADDPSSVTQNAQPQSGTKAPAPAKRGPSTLAVGVLIGALAIGAPIGGVVGGLAGAGIALSKAPAPSIIERPSTSPSALPFSTTSSTADLSALYQQVVPSIVQLNVSGGGSGGGIGAGFVIDRAGHILTNNHVVRGARDVTIRFQNGQTATARVVGTDPSEDVALLVATIPNDVKPLILADSDAVKPGETAFAIGSPFGLGYTITSGIVSGIERTSQASGSGGRPMRGLIQTDAAINPGNSGGPLFNGKGEVIGINTLGRQGVDGVGFAVPINAATRILPQLLAGETVKHARLGIAVDENTTADQGVRVAQVSRDTPASMAGLREGDVIVEMDGRPIRSFDDVRRVIDDHKPGDTISIKVQRSGREVTVNATLDEWQAQG